MNRKLTRSFILFSISVLFFTNVSAQENYGVTANSAVHTTKQLSDVIAMQDAFSANRVPKRKMEGQYRPRKQPNLEAPAVSSFGAVTGTNTPSNITATQSVHSNFLATYIGDGLGFSPPDCAGDLSTTNQLMVAVNGRLKVFNVPTVTGTPATTIQTTSNNSLANPVVNVDIDAFFTNSSLGITDFSDPHVRFDRLTGRWFIVIIDITNADNNYLCVAVSNGATITSMSNFTIFYLQSSTGSTATDDFLDYPTLGIDANALYVGGNTFGPAAYRGCPIYVIRKSSLLSGTAAVFTVFQYGTGAGKSGSTDAQGIYTPQGVHNDDPSATQGYFIGTDNTAFSKVIFKRVSNPGTNPSLSADINITVPTTTYPIMQPARGSSGGLDAADDRMFAAMMMKNKITGVTSLWTAHACEVNTSGVGIAGGNRNGSRWYEFRNLTGTPTLFQSGTLFDNTASNPRGFWIPSIAMSGQGHAFMGASVAAANRRVQVAIAGRYSADASGTLQPSDTVTQSTTAYSTAGGNDRWGDFSQTIVDPKDNMTMWTFQEYCNSTNNWGLRAVQVKAPHPASSPVATATGGNFCGSNVVVTLTGTTTSNEGFFDPGADPGGPGFNRLTITCSGGIPVSNVTFVSTSVVTCQINTNGIAGGNYTFTVTNPDGQSVTAGFTLPNNCTLPVSLIDFNGRLNNRQVDLAWKTTAEINFKGFEIEKSFDGATFTYLTQVLSKGNRAAGNEYAAIDAKPFPRYTYYRLKIADIDGRSAYSNVIRINTPLNAVVISRIFPNPAKDDFSIELVAEKRATLNIDVYDLNGKKVKQFQLNAQAGLNIKKLPIGNLSAGNYIVQVKDTEGNVLEKASMVKN
jgi:hypothetical protein